MGWREEGVIGFGSEKIKVLGSTENGMNDVSGRPSCEISSMVESWKNNKIQLYQEKN